MDGATTRAQEGRADIFQRRGARSVSRLLTTAGAQGGGRGGARLGREGVRVKEDRLGSFSLVGEDAPRRLPESLPLRPNDRLTLSNGAGFPGCLKP